jgi:WD40 repeat protein
MISDRKHCINDIKFSPNGLLLAVADDVSLDIYKVEGWKRLAVIKKHSGQVTHIDWSLDSTMIQTNSLAQELMFWNAVDFSHITDITAKLRNENWASTNCIYGWAQQGLWKPDMQGTEIVRVDRSNTMFFKEYKVLAAVNESMELELYRYPCVHLLSQSVKERGHSSFITNVKWSHDDEFIYTIGGEDQTIIVWRVHKNNVL